MHNLVVCGATDAGVSSDAAMFSDFMGISMTLRMFDPEVEGTFMSCFPLEEHFQVLASKVPPITDVKWGQFGDKGRPMFAYPKEKFDKKVDLWYSYYDPYIQEENQFQVPLERGLRTRHLERHLQRRTEKKSGMSFIHLERLIRHRR